MNVKKIIKKYLKENGFDGLLFIGFSGTCSCEMGEKYCNMLNCKPAYKHSDGTFHFKKENKNDSN